MIIIRSYNNVELQTVIGTNETFIVVMSTLDPKKYTKHDI